MMMAPCLSSQGGTLRIAQFDCDPQCRLAVCIPMLRKARSAESDNRYKLGSLKANLPTDVPAELGRACRDIRMLNYRYGREPAIILILLSDRQITSSDRIRWALPGIDASGRLFWELSQESAGSAGKISPSEQVRG